MTDTATHILDTAFELMIAKGYNSFSYKDISKEVGIKTSSIHYHYPTKPDLAQAVVERYCGDFEATLEGIERQSESGLKRISLFSERLLKAFDKGRGFCLCVSLASDEKTLPSSITKKVSAFFGGALDWLAANISLGQEQGDIKEELNPKLTANATLSLLEGAMVLARAHGDEKSLRNAQRWLNGVLQS